MCGETSEWNNTRASNSRSSQPFITLPNLTVQVLTGNLSFSCHHLLKLQMSYQKPEKDFGDGPVSLIMYAHLRYRIDPFASENPQGKHWSLDVENTFHLIRADLD